MKVLCEVAKAWKAWTEVRNARTKSAGETVVVSWAGGSSKSGKVISGSGGPKGDCRGEAKSISYGEKLPMESWGTELYAKTMR